MPATTNSRRSILALFLWSAASLVAGADEPPKSRLHAELLGPVELQATIYDADPQHLWNRLHAAFFIRRGADGRGYGEDRLEPLLWPGTKHLVGKDSRDRAVAVLDTFIETRGERLVVDPVKRAVLQRDLWLVYNWLEGDHPVHLMAEPKPSSEEIQASRRQLLPRLASIIGRLAHSPEENRKLPDNYAAAVASNRFAKEFDAANPGEPFLPPDLFEKDGPWVCVGRKDGPAAPEHLDDGGGNSFTNSTFLTLLRLPGERADTLKFLKRLNDFDEPLLVQADKNWRGFAKMPNPNLPALPAGTEVALVRQLLRIDSSRRVVPSPLTESVQLRVYREAPAMTWQNFNAALLSGTEANRRAQSWQSFYEFRLSRKELFAGRAGGLVTVGSGDRDFKTGFAAHPWDEFERLPVVDRPFAETSRPVIRQMCFACHSLPGIYSLNSLFNFRTSDLRGARDDTSHTSRAANLSELPVAEARKLAKRWIEGRPNWSALRTRLENAVEPFDGWGTTVNGLRLQLVAVRKEYVVGETMDLMLLLQNVSDKEVEIPGITLMPTIANGKSHPYGERHSYNTMISFRIPNGDVCILWSLQQVVKEVNTSLRLSPGELHVATIQLPRIAQEEALAEREKRAEFPLRVGGRDYGGGLTRHTARFPLAHDPGRYVLRARYHPGGLAKAPHTELREDADSKWNGKILESNSIELLIVAPKQDEAETP